MRELENLIQRLMVIVDGNRIRRVDLPDSMRYSVPGENEESLKLEDIVHSHILRILEKAGGNKSLAAKLLDIDRKTLASKLKRMNP